jgi:hypothetical protein
MALSPAPAVTPLLDGCQWPGMDYVHFRIRIDEVNQLNVTAANALPANQPLSVPAIFRVRGTRPVHHLLNFLNRATMLRGVIEVPGIPAKHSLHEDKYT